MRFGGHEVSDAVSTRSMAVSSSGTPVESSQAVVPSSPDNPHSLGIDAVKKLRHNYNVNKVRMVVCSWLEK